MNKHCIQLMSMIKDKSVKRISEWAENNPDIIDLVKFLSAEFQLDCTTDREIVRGCSALKRRKESAKRFHWVFNNQ